MMKKIVILTIGVFILSACTATDTLSRKEKNVAYQTYITDNKLEAVKYIRSFNMGGWQSLTNNFLMLSMSPKRHFLLQTKGQCYDLEYAQALVTHQSMSGRLITNFDAISTASFPKSKCYIKHIYPITKIQYKALQTIGKPVKDNKIKES
jgi:hypothetical protein